MARKRITAHVQKKTKQAESWENTAELAIPLAEPEEFPEEAEPVRKSKPKRKPKPNPKPITIEPEPESQKFNTMYLLFVVMIIIIILVIVLGYFSMKSLHESLTLAESSIMEIATETQRPTEPETLPPTEKETIQILVPEAPPTELNTEISDFSDFSALLSDMYQQYAQVLQALPEGDCKGGYLVDLNQDGLDELILFRDVQPACYEIYQYQGKKAIATGTFGSYSTYLYFDESELYQLSGVDGSMYLHYQDNFEKQMITGYYSTRNADSLSVLLEYGQNLVLKYRVKWHVFYQAPDAELAELNAGSTLADDLYEIPTACQKKINSYLEEYNFWIAENHAQVQLDFLPYETLLDNLTALSAT